MHDWAKEQPIHAAAIKRLTRSEFVTVYFRFPEDCVRRAVGTIYASWDHINANNSIEQGGPLYNALNKYFKLRMQLSDQPLLRSIETYHIWAHRATYPTLDFRAGQTPRQIIEATIHAIDNGGNDPCPSQWPRSEELDKFIEFFKKGKRKARSKQAESRTSLEKPKPTPPSRRSFSTSAIAVTPLHRLTTICPPASRISALHRTISAHSVSPSSIRCNTTGSGPSSSPLLSLFSTAICFTTQLLGRSRFPGPMSRVRSPCVRFPRSKP